MASVIEADSIDFAQYMQESEPQARVKSAPAAIPPITRATA